MAQTQTKEKEEEEEEERRCDQLKGLIKSLRSQKALLSDENNALKMEIEQIRKEMGGKLYQERGPMSELVKTVEQLRETLAKKMEDKSIRSIASGKPLRVVVAEVGVSGSEKLAQEILERGDMPLTPASKENPRVEEL